MRVALAVVADYVATTNDGKLIIGGVFDKVVPPAFPWVHPSMGLALRINFEPDEDQDHELVVRFIDPDGNPVIPELVAELSHPPDRPSGQTQSMQLALGMGGVRFNGPGPHRIDIIIDGRYQDSVELGVEPSASLLSEQ